MNNNHENLTLTEGLHWLHMNTSVSTLYVIPPSLLLFHGQIIKKKIHILLITNGFDNAGLWPCPLTPSFPPPCTPPWTTIQTDIPVIFLSPFPNPTYKKDPLMISSFHSNPLKGHTETVALNQLNYKLELILD